MLPPTSNANFLILTLVSFSNLGVVTYQFVPPPLDESVASIKSSISNNNIILSWDQLIRFQQKLISNWWRLRGSQAWAEHTLPVLILQRNGQDLRIPTSSQVFPTEFVLADSLIVSL